jgi:hypothetical protein
MIVALSTFCSARAELVFQDFVKVQGDQLMENGRPFRFISFNIPNLHLVEDNVAFAEENPWRLPNHFEIADALESVRQMGGTVVRTYVISVIRTNDAPGAIRHVLGPGKFNEDAFRALDEVLSIANETGVRVVIPLVDNWSWMGGRAEYAGFRGKSKDDFWTDPQIIADYEETIRFILTRTNTITGVAYCDDKGVLAWETGNELQSPAPWTRQIAAFIKSLDHNHPVIDGFNANTLRDESIAMPEVDIVTTHHYPGGKKPYAEYIRANRERTRGKKPYFVGEFGFDPTDDMRAVLETVRETGVSGALLWSLRPHNRDGGFYWHSEPSGGDHYKAYHWPGFASGNDYDESNVLALMRTEAFQIRGLPVPAVAAPAPPHLLPIADAAAISWQGSAGASGYQVERATAENGPWQKIADHVDDSAVQYRPLFNDTAAPRGTFYYRVRAVNGGGVSEASNIQGPVKVDHATLVDELNDFSQMRGHSGALDFQTHQSRKAKEHAHRLAGKSGDWIIYQLPAPIRACRLYAFFPGDVQNFHFSVSTDGLNYQEIPSTQRIFFHGAGDYGYWKPVEFDCKSLSGDAKYLRVDFVGEAQIGRIEIEHDLGR